MITVHHLDTSRSERIVWLLEEMGLPYRIARYERGPERLAPESLRVSSPTGKAPALQDGDVALAESGAIVSYLLGRHGGGSLLPAPADADFPAYLFWLHFSEGTLGAQLLRLMAIDRLGLPDPDALPGVARTRRNAREAVALVEETLGRSPFVAGARFTGADIMIPFWFTTALQFVSVDLGAHPNIRGYLARIGERPAYRRAMETAGPGATG